jgi:hypothetical protein
MSSETYFKRGPSSKPVKMFNGTHGCNANRTSLFVVVIQEASRCFIHVKLLSSNLPVLVESEPLER